MWGTKTDKILGLQKKALRIITLCQSYTAHTDPIFKTLNILKVNDILKLKLLGFYYKLRNKNYLLASMTFNPLHPLAVLSMK